MSQATCVAEADAFLPHRLRMLGNEKAFFSLTHVSLPDHYVRFLDPRAMIKGLVAFAVRFGFRACKLRLRAFEGLGPGV